MILLNLYIVLYRDWLVEMAKIEPLELMTDQIDEEMILLDDARSIIEMGDSKGVTIPPIAQKNGNFDGGSVECHFDPSTGAIVYIPSSEV